MTGRGREPTPSDVVAARVAASRRMRGWTAKQLAERCAELGATQITAATLANIESGRRDKDGRRRRDVSVDELLALALALSVAPVHLLVPPDPDGTGEGQGYYQVTPTFGSTAKIVRGWIRGQTSMGVADDRIYFREVPADEFSPVVSLESLANLSEPLPEEPDDDGR